MLTITRIHFIAPDGYLRIVMAGALHETGAHWMRTEVGLWLGYGLLSPSTWQLLADTSKGISLCSGVWNLLIVSGYPQILFLLKFGFWATQVCTSSTSKNLTKNTTYSRQIITCCILGDGLYLPCETQKPISSRKPI